MVKTTWRSDRRWSAIFSVIVYCWSPRETRVKDTWNCCWFHNKRYRIPKINIKTRRKVCSVGSDIVWKNKLNRAQKSPPPKPRPKLQPANSLQLQHLTGNLKMVTWRSYPSPITNWQYHYHVTRNTTNRQGRVKNSQQQGQTLWKKKGKKAHPERSNWHIQSTHPTIKDITMNKTIIHPPHDSLLMFVIGTSRDLDLWWHQLCGGVSMPCPVHNTRHLWRFCQPREGMV